MDRILPKDIVLYIYQIVHKQIIQKLNEEYKKVSTLIDCHHNFTLLINNIPYGSRYYINSYVCVYCREYHTVQPFCMCCSELSATYCLQNLPRRYIYSSGMQHPHGFKQLIKFENFT